MNVSTNKQFATIAVMSLAATSLLVIDEPLYYDSERFVTSCAILFLLTCKLFDYLEMPYLKRGFITDSIVAFVMALSVVNVIDCIASAHISFNLPNASDEEVKSAQIAYWDVYLAVYMIVQALFTTVFFCILCRLRK